jgi:hypothetical protein
VQLTEALKRRADRPRSLLFVLFSPLLLSQERRAFTVSFDLHGGRVLLKGKLNGRPATFLLDTDAGADAWTRLTFLRVSVRESLLPARQPRTKLIHSVEPHTPPLSQNDTLSEQRRNSHPSACAAWFSCAKAEREPNTDLTRR